MTMRDFILKHQFSLKRATSQLFIALVAALGTHYLDVIAVKDRVDNIRTEQILNSKWRIESQQRWERFDKNDLPTILHGQWLLNKRLCRLLAAQKQADEECNQVLWREKNSQDKSPFIFINPQEESWNRLPIQRLAH